MNKPVESPGPDPAEILRHEAIDRYIRGEKPSRICKALGRSRRWFYNVLKRYRQVGRDGLRTQSRAPQQVHNRTPAEVEAAIVRVRQTITSGQDPELRYANIGAETIAFELERVKLTPPHRATINRVLRRHGLAEPRPRKAERAKLPDDYPWPQAEQPNALHVFDFVSRAFVGGGRCHGYHLLDCARRWPFLRVETSKSVELVSQFLLAGWREVGLPTGLHLDNDLVWNGGGRGQRVLSTIVRLCLSVGVEVIFIPPYTPQANPLIESFNDVWDTNFWHRTQFRNADHLQTELPVFEWYCRHRRPLTDLGGRTADQVVPDFQPMLLPATFDLDLKKSLALTTGYVHFIRFVSLDGHFSVLNETWTLDKERWAGRTIRATIDTALEQLNVYYQPAKHANCQLIAQFDYPLAEPVQALACAYQREHAKLWSATTNSLVKV
jgi:transposase InsO family protein